ncbi:hypothetical protein NM688_g2680 [Phlebia brevispora]|uniref:Uncharacterized protein n=1 Tax=Phlebia brevispora TaxID=194682 RepID=A0ACC1T804_9APHY|nr:hypothetical protein NM688_g2680 [Phlebia brevispora]
MSHLQFLVMFAILFLAYAWLLDEETSAYTSIVESATTEIVKRLAPLQHCPFSQAEQRRFMSILARTILAKPHRAHKYVHFVTSNATRATIRGQTDILEKSGTPRHYETVFIGAMSAMTGIIFAQAYVIWRLLGRNWTRT